MTLRNRIATLAVALAMLVATPRAMAAVNLYEPDQDLVKLKDGRELKGTIVKEQNGYIWIDLGVGPEMFISPSDIQEIVRGSDEPIPSGEEAAETIKAKADKEQSWERIPGVTRAAIITTEGTVGMQMAAKPLREAIPLLKEEGVDLVVFKVNSGGGMLLEIQRLSDVIQNEYKPEFQVVGWIDSAISAAAMTAITIEELYFMPKGNFGACTGWYGDLQAVEGRGLEDVLYKMEKISARGNKNPFIMRAMQINWELSYDVDEETGKVSFYDSLDGEHVLNDGTEILTFNANSARDCGFSSGTAGTIEELQALLEKSVGEIVWVGEKVEGIPYPVCKAEQYQRDYRKEVDFQETRFAEIVNKYAMELQNAQSVPVDSRGGFLRRAESFLAQIKRLHNINPNFGLRNGYDGDWIRRQEEVIRQLRRG